MAATPEQASVVVFVTDVGIADVTATEVDVAAVVVVGAYPAVDDGKAVCGDGNAVAVVLGLGDASTVAAGENGVAVGVDDDSTVAVGRNRIVVGVNDDSRVAAGRNGVVVGVDDDSTVAAGKTDVVGVDDDSAVEAGRNGVVVGVGNV